MDRLVSIDHLSGTAVLKLAPEDEEKDTKIERKSQRNTGHECSGAAGGVCKRLRGHAQGKDQARRVDSLICHF